jgi:hypothetical protein
VLAGAADPPAAQARDPTCRRLPCVTPQGEAGTGNVVEAVRHARAVQGAIRALQTMDDDELYVYAKVRYAPPSSTGVIGVAASIVWVGWLEMTMSSMSTEKCASPPSRHGCWGWRY